MASRPRQVTVSYRGIPHVLDLVRCRRALVDRQVEGGLDSLEGLAQEVGISRSTTSRFFSGKLTSLAVTLRVLDALHLTLHEVATLVDDGDAGTTTSDGTATSAPHPQDGLASIGLSGYALNCLRAAGITTVEQVLERTDDQLLDIRNLGRRSLDEIRAKLLAQGFGPTGPNGTVAPS